MVRSQNALNPRLIGVAGPAEGGVFGLSDDDLSIGRDTSNHLSIDDPSLAAFHCRISRQKEEFQIQDLGSCGTTIVNGLPVTERLLMHGDQIHVGQCRFVFLRWDADVESDRDIPDTGAGQEDVLCCAQPGREDCSFRMAAPAPEQAAVNSQTRCSLTAMLRIAAGLRLVRKAESIAQQLLEGIFEVVPAQHGGVLLFDGQSREPSFASYRDRETGPTNTVRTYSAIVDQARHRAKGILAIDVRPDPNPTEGDLGDPHSRSVLVAPIIISARTLGVLYVDSCVPSVPFREDHLELASSFGAILGMALENARRVEWLEMENSRLQETIGVESEMVGTSPRMRDVYRLVSKVAPTNCTVLIRGESGTGKELVARAIHRNSLRAGQLFLAINCATLSETLLESELFGHEKGAFTGAILQKRGKLELADHGTVFLDEIGEMPLTCQAKVLRVLQEREFERVGGSRQIRSDVRLIAATNRDLEIAIQRGTFRKDLYYRLNVVSLPMPPLRDRREDIPLLANYFVAKHGKRAGRKVTGISGEALACLQAHDWPGNVRDLENAIERAVVLGSTDLILAEDLPENVLEAFPDTAGLIGGYHEAVRKEKIRVILATLNKAGGRFTEGAKLLGIHPNYLHRLVHNLNLRDAIRDSSES